MLSHAFPRPARITLAGRSYKAHQLRLVDLAYLERWAGGGFTVWSLLAAAESEPDEHARHDLLREAWQSARRGDDGFGSAVVSERLATPAGRVVVLWLALRRGQRFSQADAVGLAEKLTASEWLVVETIAWCLDPLDLAATAIDREIGARWVLPERADEKGDWCDAVACVARQFGGYEAVGRMTLAQWDAARRVTEAPAERLKREHPVAYPNAPLNEANIEAARKRAAFWGITSTDEDSSDESPPPNPATHPQQSEPGPTDRPDSPPDRPGQPPPSPA